MGVGAFRCGRVCVGVAVGAGVGVDVRGAWVSVLPFFSVFSFPFFQKFYKASKKASQNSGRSFYFF